MNRWQLQLHERMVEVFYKRFRFALVGSYHNKFCFQLLFYQLHIQWINEFRRIRYFFYLVLSISMKKSPLGLYQTYLDIGKRGIFLSQFGGA